MSRGSGRRRLPWRGLLEAAWVLAGVLLTLYTVHPGRGLPPSRDSGAFLYIGWRWLEGDIPYRDVWDHKPPGVYAVDALGLRLGRGSLWGVWGMEVLFLAVAAAGGYALLRRWWGVPVALLVTYLWLYTLVFLLDGGNLTQEYALPFQFAMFGLWAAVARRHPSSATAWAAALGVVTAGAFLFRPNTIAPALVGLALWWLDASLPWRVRARRTLAFGLGFGVVVGLVAAYFAWQRALGAFWEQAFVFNYLYAQERGLKRRVLEVARGLRQFPATGLWPLALLGYAALLAWRRAARPAWPRSVRLLLLLTFPAELVMVALPGRGRVPYFTSLLPILALLAAVALAAALDRLDFAPARRAWGPWLAAGALLTAWGGLHALAYHDYLKATAAEPSPVAAVVAYVQQHTRPDETVLVIGAEPEVNFLARRRSPTRFVYQYPLYRRRYAGETYLVQFYQEVLAGRPRLIVVALPEAEGDIPDHFGPNRSTAAARLVGRLRAQYQRVADFDGWAVYARVTR